MRRTSRLLIRDRARGVFSDTFSHMYDALPFAQYLEATYGPGGAMTRTLTDNSIQWRVAAIADQPIGYAKL